MHAEVQQGQRGYYTIIALEFPHTLRVMLADWQCVVLKHTACV